MANVLEQELFNYFTRLNEQEKKSFVQLLKDFLSNQKENTPVPSLEEYTKEIEMADAEIEANSFVLHEDVVRYFSKKWSMPNIINWNKEAFSELVKVIDQKKTPFLQGVFLYSF